jgi:UDPglucose 6-dehydrogenase
MEGTKSTSEPDLEKVDNVSMIPARQPNLAFTTESEKSIAEADMIFIAVNTPTKTVGLGAGYATDMTALESAVKDIAAYAKNGAILVEKSTVPCRTARFIQDTVCLTR